MLTKEQEKKLDQIVPQMTVMQMADYLGEDYLRECVFGVAEENIDADAVADIEKLLVTKPTKQYYLVTIWGDVEPSVHSGPFETEDQVLEAAREYRKSSQISNDMYSLYYLEIENGKPELSSFSGEELDGDEPEQYSPEEICEHCGGTFEVHHEHTTQCPEQKGKDLLAGKPIKWSVMTFSPKQ